MYHYATTKNFFSAQASVSSVTSPDNIPKEIYKAATHEKGPLHIVSGGDVKLFAFLKKVLSQRAFQRLQIRSIIQPATKSEISFAKWLMGRNVARLEVGIDKNLIE
jgi:hypothetical protein